jgi:hypothetical protein
LTIALVILLVQCAVAARRPAVRTIAIGAVACMTLLVVPASRGGLSYWQTYTIQRQADLAAIRRGNVAAAADSFPSVAKLRRYVQELRRVHDGPFHP